MTLSQDELLEVVRRQAALIAELRETIARLEARVRDLEDGSAPPRRMPGHKREQAQGDQAVRPRRKRAEHQSRRRSDEGGLGLTLRNLAVAWRQSLSRLPPAARFPSILNSYI